MLRSAVTHVFADGGCILGNPSAYGGTWAYLYADLAGDRKIDGRCGVVTNASFGTPEAVLGGATGDPLDVVSLGDGGRITVAFDYNQDNARAKRRELFEMAVRENMLIGAVHLPFPGIGRLRAGGNASGFVYEPLPWQLY